MRVSERYTKGAGNAALGLRARKLGQYWDWIASAAVSSESVNTFKLLTEYADADDAIESCYAVEFTPPSNGPWDLELVVISTGATIASGDTEDIYNTLIQVLARFSTDYAPVHRYSSGGALLFKKTVYDEFTRYCDFSPLLNLGETILSATGQVFDDAGVDQSASMIASVAPYAPANTKVKYLIKGGEAGKAYRIILKIVTSNAQKFESDINMTVI